MDGDDEEELRLRYKIPLYSKPYDLAWQANHIIKNTEEDDFENVETINFFAFGVSRDWNTPLFTTPLTVRTTIAFEDRALDEPYPESIEAREAGMFNRLRLGLVFDDVHLERFDVLAVTTGLTSTRALTGWDPTMIRPSSSSRLSGSSA